MVEPVCYCTENFTCHLHKPDEHAPDTAATQHFACMLATMLDCMQGSDEYCCEACVVNQIKDWCMEWLKELREEDHGSHA